MKKSALSIAVASMLAAPAAVAQTSNVQLYGRAVLGLDNYEAKGARSQGAVPGSAIDYDSRFRVYDNSSRVGLRGTEDLGNGLKAIFQIETGVNIDNGSNTGQSGGGNANTGFWAARDSFVGVDSNFGRLTFGRQSVYWANGVNAQFSANYINSQVPWTDGTQLGRISRGPAGAISRYNNVVQYTSPTFAGINGTLSYSPTNQEAVQSSSTTDTNGDMWGATLRGTWGPFYAQADWARQKVGTPAAGGTAPFAAQGVTPEWEGYKLGASWGYLPGARIGVIWVRSESNAALLTEVGANARQDGWTINWEHTFGNFQALAQFGWTGDLSNCGSSGTPGVLGSSNNIAGAGAATTVQSVSCADTDATAFMVGGRYLLSKRTWVFASYNQVNNQVNNFADFTGGSITSVAGNGTPLYPMGADPKLWAIGIFHQF